MIKFFRKIRYDLMEKNKTGKYLKYAIGEIVLVVIGILIALSINNWNEERKDSILEKYYLNRLIDDLKADITEIDSTAKYASKFISIGNNILELLGENYISDLKKLSNSSPVFFIENALNQNSERIALENFGQSFGYLFDERLVDMNNFTYNELISTGKFEVIKNRILRKDITNYYLSFNAVLDVQDNLLFSISEYNKALKNNNIPIINSFSFEELKIQLNSIEGQELQTSLKNLIWNHAYSISPFQNKFKPLSNELIKEIKNYLKQK
jgi:Family of unknown function (DUF6090)